MPSQSSPHGPCAAPAAPSSCLTTTLSNHMRIVVACGTPAAARAPTHSHTRTRPARQTARLVAGRVASRLCSPQPFPIVRAHAARTPVVVHQSVSPVLSRSRPCHAAAEAHTVTHITHAPLPRTRHAARGPRSCTPTRTPTSPHAPPPPAARTQCKGKARAPLTRCARALHTPTRAQRREGGHVSSRPAAMAPAPRRRSHSAPTASAAGRS